MVILNSSIASIVILRQEHLFLYFIHVLHSNTGSIKWSHGVEFPDTEGVLVSLFLVAPKMKYNTTISTVTWW